MTNLINQEMRVIKFGVQQNFERNEMPGGTRSSHKIQVPTPNLKYEHEEGHSTLTGSVPCLEILFRFTHKICSNRLRVPHVSAS